VVRVTLRSPCCRLNVASGVVTKSMNMFQHGRCCGPEGRSSSECRRCVILARVGWFTGPAGDRHGFRWATRVVTGSLPESGPCVTSGAARPGLSLSTCWGQRMAAFVRHARNEAPRAPVALCLRVQAHQALPSPRSPWRSSPGWSLRPSSISPVGRRFIGPSQARRALGFNEGRLGQLLGADWSGDLGLD
jgi:hypothetical protein